MNHLSLFTGIGGFDLACEKVGITTVGQIEIDPFCNQVLAVRWPKVRRWGDVRSLSRESERIGDSLSYDKQPEIGSESLVSISLLTGGWPCQDLSVAGKRSGLAGERSGLFWEIVRIAKIVRPAFLLLENVPGLLSSNGGADIGLILDALHEAGYLTEVEECDSQNFGVPQRRRRLFFIGVGAAYGLQKQTHFSSTMLAAVIAQSLLDVWELLSPLSATESAHSESPNASIAAIGVSRRMKSYAASQEPSAWPRLLRLLEERFLRSESRPENWVCPSFQPGLMTLKATASKVITESDGENIGKSWQRLWGDLWKMPSESTILTWSKTTTAETICTCAEATVNISRLIGAWSGSCLHCWSAASLSLTALLACIASLSQLADDLFVEACWRDRARVLLTEAETAASDALSRPTEAGVAKVLFEPEGSERDSEEGREAGAGIASSLAVGINASGLRGRQPGSAATMITQALSSAKSGMRFDPNGEDYVVGTLKSGGDVKRGWKVDAENAADGHLVVAPITSGYAKGVGVNDGRKRSPQNLLLGRSVRRLTPTECERLQGFPDGWTCLCQPISEYDPNRCKCPDGPRYRALGNAVTVNTAEWILGRLVRSAF